MKPQAIIKTLHIWIGLIFGAFISITCLSGSVIVFRQEIEAALAPKMHGGERRASLDDAVAAVAAANPDARLTRLSFERGAYLMTLETGEKTSRRILVDAATGQPAGSIDAPWLDWISDLHHNLLYGKAGRRIQGGIGALLFVVSTTGAILFLLRNPSWRAATTVHATGSQRRFHFDLHRVAGVWAYSFLALLGATGFALAYPELLGKAAPVPKVKTGKSMRALSEYLAAAGAAVPGAELSEIRLPKSAKDPVSIRYHLASDFGRVGRNEIALDASTARVLAIRDNSGLPPGPRLQRAVTPFHYAEFGGLFVKVLWSVAGVTPTLLFITGLSLWFGKKPERAAVAESEESRELVRG